VALDHGQLDEIVGTIAGDDTVLVITPDAEGAARFRERMLAILAK
jgi:transcriptional regulator of arginine metabolism